MTKITTTVRKPHLASISPAEAASTAANQSAISLTKATTINIHLSLTILTIKIIRSQNQLYHSSVDLINNFHFSQAHKCQLIHRSTPQQQNNASARSLLNIHPTISTTKHLNQNSEPLLQILAITPSTYLPTEQPTTTTTTIESSDQKHTNPSTHQMKHSEPCSRRVRACVPFYARTTSGFYLPN